MTARIFHVDKVFEAGEHRVLVQYHVEMPVVRWKLGADGQHVATLETGTRTLERPVYSGFSDERAQQLAEAWTKRIGQPFPFEEIDDARG